MGQYPLDAFDQRLERTRRTDPQPLRAGPERERLQLRVGRGDGCQLAAIAVGTETDGSITSPASLASLVGIKPTRGLISRAGVIPIAPSQDTPGPMARTVADAAALLSVLAGSDP